MRELTSPLNFEMILEKKIKVAGKNNGEEEKGGSRERKENVIYRKIVYIKKLINYTWVITD